MQHTGSEGHDDPFDRLGCILSPQWPLKFEKLEGSFDDEFDDQIGELELKALVAGVLLGDADLHDLHQKGEESLFAEPQMYQATLKALLGHASAITDADAVQLAWEALEICEICPEAYIVLALREANTYEEALEYFKKAMEQGTKIKTPDELKKVLNSKILWKNPEMRSYLRAIFGVGNTLRKMRRCEEALPYYEKLQKLIPVCKPYEWKSFLDFNAHFPQLWFEVYGPEECLKRMSKTTEMSHAACRLSWIATMSLALFASGKYTEFKGTISPCEFCEPTPFWERMKNLLKGNCWRDMLYRYDEMVDLLLGKEPMPAAETMPLALPAPYTLISAAVYLHDGGARLWKSIPGAMHFLLQMRNTCKLFIYFYGTSDAEGHRIKPQKIDMDYVKELMDEGFLVNASQTNTLLVWAYEIPEVALELLKRGADPCFESPPYSNSPNGDPTAFQRACYYDDTDLEVVRIMAEISGNKAYLFSQSIEPPIAMAVQQGNWQILDVILSVAPFGANRTFEVKDAPNRRVSGPEYIWDTLAGSTCRLCVAGSPERCHRCTNEAPHAAKVDFRKVVDVLLKHEIKPPKTWIKEFKKSLTDTSGECQAEINKAFAKYVLWKLEKQQAGSGEEVEWCSYPLCCKRSDAAVPLKYCSKCKYVKYCSLECQKKHWKVQHKLCCKALKGQK